MNPLRIVVMGVSGCGKSTLGLALAEALHLHFIEGDGLHSPANVERMAAGIALTDAGRHDWLQSVAARLGNVTASSAGLVVSCSALKRSYRNLLRSGAADLRFVHLHGDPGLLSQRMAARQGHYMPASLLQSQLDTLEPPGDDEQPIRLDIAWPLERQLAEALRQLAPAPALPVPSAPSPNPTPP